MPVIALTQGMGSLAQDIAEQLAHELGLATLQHEVAERVADKMHVSKSLISRLRAGKAGPIERLRADRHSIAVYTAEEVLEAAARGDVVVRGWGGTQLLRQVPHIPCVRIMRPFDKRVQWLMKELDTDDVALAESEIRRSDQANASRMHDQFGVQWATRRCSTWCSTPIACRWTPACSRSEPCSPDPSLPKHPPRSRCCRAWPRVPMSVPRCAPIRKPRTST